MEKFSQSRLVLLVATGLMVGNVSAAPSHEAFGSPYTSVSQAAESQSKVVYYRDAQRNTAGEAFLYVDGEFHNVLLPGSYTVFCLSPGLHNLGSYMNDSPSYAGKKAGQQLKLKAGKTYFLRVAPERNGVPEILPRDQTEAILKQGIREQVHVLSRASAVQPCQVPSVREYSLSADVLFRFGGGSGQDISRGGYEAIRSLASRIHSETPNIRQIRVVGHTDSLGSDAVNIRLGAQRAQTVRKMLMEAGLPGEKILSLSAGSSRPVVSNCRGSRTEQINCNAPNRRVTLFVESGDKS